MAQVSKLKSARVERIKLAEERTRMLKDLEANLREGMILSNSDHNGWVILLKDASSPGKHRYQCFDKKGFSSHHTFETLEEALKDAFYCGYKIEEEDGLLDSLAQTTEWQRGMAIQAVRDRYNQGQINWDELLRLIREFDAGQAQ